MKHTRGVLGTLMENTAGKKSKRIPSSGRGEKGGDGEGRGEVAGVNAAPTTFPPTQSSQDTRVKREIPLARIH